MNLRLYGGWSFRRALSNYGWLVALAVAVLALAVVYTRPIPAIIPATVDRSIEVPREITEVQPADVACKGAVTVSEATQGRFYRAELGKYVLSWTEPLDKTVLTDGRALDYPEADKTITDCLRKRAKEAGPSQ